MKRIATILLAAMLTAAAVPAFAEMTKEEKNQCLLASKGCLNEVDSLQQRIRKLNREIRKGTRVYSADELKTLEQKLKDVNEFLKNLERPGKGK